MEMQTLQWWQCLALLTATFSAILFLGIFKPWKGRCKTHNLPPGPKAWPVIGHMLLLKPPVHKTMKPLAEKYGPVMLLKLGFVDTVVISSSRLASHFFKTYDAAFASRPRSEAGRLIFYDHGDMVFSPYGSYWRDVRKLCVVHLLNTKRVESFASVRKQEVTLMVQNIWEMSKNGVASVNISKEIGTYASNIMWRIICGRKFGWEEEIAQGFTFKSLVDELVVTTGAFNLGDFIPFMGWMDLQGLKRRMKRVNVAYDSFADGLINERLKSHNSEQYQSSIADFLDILLQNTLEMHTIKAIMLDMASGGTETSATTIDWVMSLLLKHPTILRKLRKEIDEVIGKDEKFGEEHIEKLKYLHCVVRESMRLHPAVPLTIPHYSVEENTKLFGYELPSKSILFINLWAIGRDPQVWEEPEKFEPERFMNDENVDLSGVTDMRSIPFSGGRRGCPGTSMALPMIFVAVGTLVHTFEWKIDEHEEIDMTEAVGVTAPRKYPLLAKPHKRRHWTSCMTTKS